MAYFNEVVKRCEFRASMIKTMSTKEKLTQPTVLVQHGSTVFNLPTPDAVLKTKCRPFTARRDQWIALPQKTHHQPRDLPSTAHVNYPKLIGLKSLVLR